MKLKTLSLIIAACAAAVLTACGSKDTVTTDASTLPQAARQTISQYFPNAKVALVKVEKENFGSDEYEVTLNNGARLDFRADGTMDKISAAPGDSIPSAAVPADLRNFINENFIDPIFVNYELDKNHQEVGLASGLELKFDLNGKFIGYDD